MSRLGAGLLAIAAVLDLVLGVSAVAGAERLEANVREIETSPNGGDLYFGLGTWGVILLIVGALLAAGAWSLVASKRGGRLTGLIGAFFALAAAFFGLPIFRWPAVVAVLVLLSATYVLAYGLREDEGSASDA